MSNASFQVYIDESGCEGFRFDSGSPEWFVLSAVITCTSNDLETVKLIDAVRETIGIQQRNALHFRSLKHERRIPYVNAIANGKIRAISILVHKPSLEEKENFQSKNILYFYATRFLIERISWFCREMHSTNQPGDGSSDLVFSKRKNMSYEELKEYLNRLEMQSQHKDIRIDWNYIKKDQIKAYDHSKRMGLQIADAVASSFFHGLQKSKYGYIESAYGKILKPIVFKRKGQYWGYGLKPWPITKEWISNQNEIAWLTKTYNT